jgi:hypothetical protein
VLKKIDDMSGEQIQVFFSDKKSTIEERSEEYSRSNVQEERSSAFFENKRLVSATHGLPPQQGTNLASQKIMHLTQRQFDLERLVDIKDEAI